MFLDTNRFWHYAVFDIEWALDPIRISGFNLQ